MYTFPLLNMPRLFVATLFAKKYRDYLSTGVLQFARWSQGLL
jgi:hypothetical protein